jgi:hypothetical protein
MRKIILAILAFSCFLNGTVFGQAFTTAHDTVSASTSANVLMGIHNTVISTSTTVFPYSWRVTSHNLPQDWVNADFSLCDGTSCYDTAVLHHSTQIDSVSATRSPDLQLHVKPGTSNGTYYVSLQLKDVANTTTKNITFLFNKWPTGIQSIVKTDDNVTLYPNPARENVNVVFDESLNAKSVAVYNLIGKVVSYYRVSGNSAAIDLSDAPAGIYFLRLINAQGEVVATRKFTHQ